MKTGFVLFIQATWLAVLFAKTCRDIPKVDNSIASFWGNDAGKEVTFMCSRGYQLFGEKTLFCTSSGEWHAPAPICKAVSARTSEPDEEDEDSETLVTETTRQTISAALNSQSLHAAVCEDVRKLKESLSCVTNWMELKSIMEMEKNRLKKLIFQKEGRPDNQLRYPKET
ncbi:C4b-binding protein beta chain [Carettochelys insculpta]|uniref:C4b-binding protein beta chain n=1 Tax=Carettochelys insculpta TaxID=44489 RepID=UPI003EBA6F5F